MANGYISPERKMELIQIVGEEFLATGESSRNLSNILLNKYGLKLSHVSVLKYIRLFALVNVDESSTVKSYIDDNTEETIDDPAVCKRVYAIAEGLLGGKTIKEVSLELGITYWTAYRDINERLRNLNQAKYEEVKNALKYNSTHHSTHSVR